jgi:hypothetical protein
LAAICDKSGGFLIETDHHLLAHIPGRDRLVVSFDNFASTNETVSRMPFGYSFLRSYGWGVLGVIAKRKDWFQCPKIKGQMSALAEGGFFASYPSVSFYGASMGGFGALAFAGLAPRAQVMAFAPQSTLRPDRVPFETRYAFHRRLGQWDGAFTDAAASLADAGQVTIVYDPMVPQDKGHVARIAERCEAPLLALKARHFSHKIPPMLLGLGILREVAEAGLTGTLTQRRFSDLARSRRTAPRYLAHLLKDADRHGHAALALKAGPRILELCDRYKTRSALRQLARNLAETDTTASAL